MDEKKDKKVDTSELLNDSDIELLNQISKVKKHIFSYIKREPLVDEIKRLIEQSDAVSFASKRAAKFVDPQKPVFSLKFNEERVKELYPPKKFKDDEDELKYLMEVLHSEVVSKFSTFLITSLREYREGKESSEIFKENPNLESLAMLMVSSIFGMKFDLEVKAVQMEYLI